MAMVKCKECGKEISSDAAVCPSCGKRLKNPPWRIVLGLLLIAMSLGIYIPIAEIQIKTEVETDTVPTITKNINDSDKKSSTKTNNSTNIVGMSEEQVKNTFGTPISSTIKNTKEGKITIKRYQISKGKKVMDIYFMDGKAYKKEIIEL